MKELKELQRMEEHNRSESNVRLNIKAYRSLQKSISCQQSNGGSKSGSSTAKRNSSVTGSNRSLNSQNSSTSKNTDHQSSAGTRKEEEMTWIHELFQGTLVNETKCLNCETVSNLKECNYPYFEFSNCTHQ